MGPFYPTSVRGNEDEKYLWEKGTKLNAWSCVLGVQVYQTSEDSIITKLGPANGREIY